MHLSGAEVEAVSERARRAQLGEAIEFLTAGNEPRLADSRSTAERLRALRDELPSEPAAKARLERIIAGNELTDVAYLARGVTAARSVGRVLIREDGRLVGYGTGFLAAPGVLVTNEHVLSSAEDVSGSSVQFRYEVGLDGSELQPIEFGFDPSDPPIIDHALDVAIVRVGDRIGGDDVPLDTFGWLRLDPTPGKGILGEYLTIVQHPGGERKQVCVRENKLLLYDDNGPYLWYQTDTVGGSSGSPVFNNSWDVVGLHHSGVPASAVSADDPLATSGAEWIANEGIRISSICSFLETQTSPLAASILHAPRAGLPSPVEHAAAPTTPQPAVIQVPGSVTITIHTEPSVTASTPPAAPAPRPTDTPASAAAAASQVPSVVGAVERVDVKPDYDRRNGYDPGFLGATVPLPTAPGPGTPLAYWNYSVLMHPTRRLARYSAANIDPANWRGQRDASGDRWYQDERCPDVVGEEFYGTQRSVFEADRSHNPFDRGHLTARRDLQWGANDAEAKRNGDDSYHFTNCAPQHHQFNQRSRANGLWFRLEELAATQTDGARVSLINGPVFDAPAGTLRPDGLVALNLDGDPRPDPTFGDVAIPTQYFKIIVWAEPEGELRCIGFVVTQEALLGSVPAMRWTTPRFERLEASGALSSTETALYRVPVESIGKLTGLDFGELTDADQTPATEATDSPLVRSRRDLRAAFQV